MKKRHTPEQIVAKLRQAPRILPVRHMADERLRST